jgi:hypothetical protein
VGIIIDRFMPILVEIPLKKADFEQAFLIFNS